MRTKPGNRDRIRSASTAVRVFLGHAQCAHGTATEINLDDYGRLVADDESVVAGLDAQHLRGTEVEDAAVGKFHVNLAPSQETYVRMHAEVGSDQRLHVLRPAKAHRIDHAFHLAAAGGNDIKLNPTRFAMFGALYGRQQDIRLSHGNRSPSQQLLC